MPISVKAEMGFCLNDKISRFDFWMIRIRAERQGGSVIPEPITYAGQDGTFIREFARVTGFFDAEPASEFLALT